jgi:hypothetical protein
VIHHPPAAPRHPPACPGDLRLIGTILSKEWKNKEKSCVKAAKEIKKTYNAVLTNQGLNARWRRIKEEKEAAFGIGVESTENR